MSRQSHYSACHAASSREYTRSPSGPLFLEEEPAMREVKGPQPRYRAYIDLSSTLANLKLMILRSSPSLRYTTKKIGGGFAISKATSALKRGGRLDARHRAS